MSFVYTDFTTAFPEFSNAATYPEGTFNFWQGIANLRLNVCRWGELLDHGAMLFIAHNMKEQAKSILNSTLGTGTKIGEVSGPVSAKSIDKISFAFATDTVTVEGAGDFNSTSYGVQFFQLALMVGSGGMQF